MSRKLKMCYSKRLQQSKEFQSKRMQPSILEILCFFFIIPDLITCQLGREFHHIPKDIRIWGHHQRNLIAHPCPSTSDCIIHQVVVELQNEAEMSSKTPHDAHAWASDSETLLSKQGDCKMSKKGRNCALVLKYLYFLILYVFLLCLHACKVEIPLCIAVCAPKNLL